MIYILSFDQYAFIYLPEWYIQIVISKPVSLSNSLLKETSNLSDFINFYEIIGSDVRLSFIGPISYT